MPDNLNNILNTSLIKLLLTPFLISFCYSPTFGQTSAAYHHNPVLGFVDGKQVRYEDVRNKKTNDLSLQLFQQLNVGLMEYSLKILASKHSEINLTPEKKVTIQDIVAFYEKNNLQERGTLKKLRPQIKQFLQQQILSQHLLNTYSLALEKGWVVSHLQPPSEFLLEGNIKTGYLRGNKKAAVIMLEYSDYQCPFCRRVQETISKLVKNYKDRVAFGYRHFPLSFHEEADEAAIAAECAREQGKFEEIHSLLYSRQKAQYVEDLKKYARQIKIKSPEKFDKCLDSEKYRGLVNQDIKDGTELGITGTPGFLVGLYNSKTGEITGEVLSGAQPYNVFQQTLDKFLSSK
jgi:protein-disulfide isomerase